MSSVSYQIEKSTINDAMEIANLVNSAYRGEASRQGWTTEADLLDGTRVTKDLIEEIIKNKSNLILKYTVGDKILGCVELKPYTRGLYLGMLTVSPTMQNKGIGKILLQAAEKYAVQQDRRSIYMTVISSRTELINWYGRHGYEKTGEIKPFKVPDERWGIPKFKLEFIVLEKLLIR